MAFDDDPDYDLMVFMAMREADPAGAKGAFGAFWRRHQPFLLQEGARYAQRLGGIEGVGDLVQDTFLRAWEKAHTFRPGSQDLPPAKQSIHARRWLLRIMKNLFLDALRAPGQLLGPLTELEPEAPAESEPADLTEEQRILREVIQELTEPEQTILFKTVECFDHASGKPVISPDELRHLASKIGTTIVNIRQIRRRTYQVVRERMKQRMDVCKIATQQCKEVWHD